MTAADRERRGAEKRGRRAEFLAVIYLLFKGYWPVERRLNTPVGEIDLIAKRGNLLAIVEVKSRPTLVQAAESISPRQWNRIARAVTWFTANRSAYAGSDIRFDAVLVSGWRVRHVQDAWRPD